MPLSCDIVVIGGGVSGLWLACRLRRAGFCVLLVEKDALGGGQTLAAQGMIHGGQKYAFDAGQGANARAAAAMPGRWDTALDGYGEVDLATAAVLSDDQVMWPAGGVLSDAALFAAARLVNAATEKLPRDRWPDVLLAGKRRGSVYRLPEKVLDMKSLVTALAARLPGCILRAGVTDLTPDGQVLAGGQAISAQLVVALAGAGNEDIFHLLKVTQKPTQRRPLGQIMVAGMEDEIFGHAVTGAPKPRLTVTSHRTGGGEYVWYLGGQLAEDAAMMDDDAALAHAARELSAVFPAIAWQGRRAAVFRIDRAEARDGAGGLPAGPALHQRGRVLFGWPSKMTFAPLLADRVMEWMSGKDIAPRAPALPESFAAPPVGRFPWEDAAWRSL